MRDHRAWIWRQLRQQSPRCGRRRRAKLIALLTSALLRLALPHQVNALAPVGDCTMLTRRSRTKR